MNRLLLTIPAILLAFGVAAQTMVSTFPSGRNAVLEEFTGVNCGNCPDGHSRANSFAAAYPGRVVILNMHGSSYSGTPDLTSSWVDPIDDFAGASAYPCGTMNRVIWPGAYNEAPFFPSNPPDNLVIRRPGWWDTSYPGQTAGEDIILNGGNAIVNIGASSSYNSSTNEVNVYVELYYTAGDTVSNLLNVAILQNGVVGYQSGGGSSYTHDHIFRDFLTGQWGDPVTNTSAGTLFTNTYTYTVPADYNGIASDISNMDIAVYVTQSDYRIAHTGVAFAADGGSFVGTEPSIDLSAFDFVVYPNPIVDETTLQLNLNEPSEVSMSMVNTLGQVVYTRDFGTQPSGATYFGLNKDYLGLTAGVYLVSMNSGEQAITKRVIVK